jgi:hypothetical protein
MKFWPLPQFRRELPGVGFHAAKIGWKFRRYQSYAQTHVYQPNNNLRLSTMAL